LWWLLNRRFRGIVDVRSTLVRVIPVSLVSGLLVFGLLQCSPPIPGVIFAVLVMGVGGLLVLPFILPEIKLLTKM
jgi:hypothetical protein